MDTNAIEHRLKENLKKEIRQEIINFTDGLQKKFGDYFDKHGTSVDILKNVNCGYMNKGQNNERLYVNYPLSSGEMGIKNLLETILIPAYEEKMLHKRVTELIAKLDVLD
jgi:hypothetical protein